MSITKEQVRCHEHTILTNRNLRIHYLSPPSPTRRWGGVAGVPLPKEPLSSFFFLVLILSYYFTFFSTF